MKEFVYEAYTRDGHKVRGVEAAQSIEDVQSVLNSRGLLPRSVSIRRRLRLRFPVGRSVPPAEVLAFVSEFLSLAESGMGIPESLAILAEDQTESGRLQEHLKRILSLVRSGASLSGACGQHPDVFDPFLVSALQTAEQSGDLIRPLRAYHRHLERTMELRRKLSQALTYPTFLLVTFAVILLFMFIFVVPNFANMYRDLSTELPGPTLLLLATVDHLPLIVLATAVVLSGGVIAVRLAAGSASGRLWLSRIKGSIPVTGKLYTTFTYWHFTQAIAALLHGGANLVSAVRSVRENTENAVFAVQLEKVIQRLSDGESLSSALRQETEYPSKSVRMIAVGEEGSNLQAMLESISDYHTRQLDDRVTRITALIEPTVMLVIGLIVGVVIVALYLPVFGMVNVIG